MGLLLVYFVGVVAWLAYRRVPVFHPAMVCSAIWLVAIGLSSLGLVEYPYQELETRTVLFVAVCHTALLAGIALVRRIPGRPQVVFSGGTETVVLACLASTFVMIQWTATLSQGEIPIIDTARNIAVERQRFLAVGSEEWTQQLARIFGYPSMGFAALLPVYVRDRLWGLVALAAATLIAIADLSIADGGRSTLVFAMGMVAIVYFASRHQRLSRFALIAVVGAALVWQLGSNFYLARNPKFAANPSVFVAYNCMGGRLGPTTYDAPPAVQAFALSSCYATTPVRTLDDFLTSWHGGHTYGLYNLGILAPESFENIRLDIASFYRTANLAGNPWATSMRDLWLDFSYWAVLAYIAIGLLIGAVTRNPFLTSEARTIRYAVIAVAVVMIPFQSPFMIRSLVYLFISTWLVAGAAGLLPVPRKRQRQRRPVLR